MVNRLQSVWRAMKSQVPWNTKSLKKIRTCILPLDLQHFIQAQVSERPRNFIKQIFEGQSSVPQPSLSMTNTSSPIFAMENKFSETADCEAKSHVQGSMMNDQTTECSPQETGNAAAHISDQESPSKSHSAKTKGKRRRNQDSEGLDEPQPLKRKRPTHFVAVQITDREIHSTAQRIQEGILQASEVDIRSTCIKPIKFHITLMVMHLEEDTVKKAAQALERLRPILADEFESREIKLDFQGLSVFGGGRVVFSPPQPSDGLTDLIVIAEKVGLHMKENGIESTDHEKKVFNPHLTLFKFKDDKHLFKQGIRKIKQSLCDPFKEDILGSQRVTSIQLCEMGEEADDGYYKVITEVDWSNKGET